MQCSVSGVLGTLLYFSALSGDQLVLKPRFARDLGDEERQALNLIIFENFARACAPARDCPIHSFSNWHCSSNFAKFVELVAPPLRHFDTLFPVEATMIGGADCIAFFVGKSSLDRIGIPEATLIE